jgi:hypothetical protein
LPRQYLKFFIQGRFQTCEYIAIGKERGREGKKLKNNINLHGIQIHSVEPFSFIF